MENKPIDSKPKLLKIIENDETKVKTALIEFTRHSESGEEICLATSSFGSSCNLSPMFYMGDVDQYATMLSDGLSMSESLCKHAIIVSNKLILFGGKCATALEIMNALSNTNMLFVSDSAELNAIMENTMTFVNYDNQRMMMGYKKLNECLISDRNVNGNSFPYVRWGMKKIENKTYFVPMAVTPLNPLGINIQESNRGMSERITYNNFSGGNGGVPVNTKAEATQEIKLINLKRIARHSKPYFWWGTPYLTKAFSDLQRKNKTIALDNAIMDGLIGLITVFSLGNPKSGEYAKKAEVERFSQLLSSRQSSAPLYLVWPGHVKVDVIGPNGEILKFDERYRTIDSDIVGSLGFPSFLLGGESKGSNSGSELSTKPLQALIEECQADITAWWVWQAATIAMRNNIKVNKLDCIWSGVNLSDEKTLISVVDNMRDRGLLSNTSACLKMRCSSNMEEYLMSQEAEKKKKDKTYVFGTPAEVPFQGKSGKPGSSTKAGGDGRPETPVEDTQKTEQKMREKAKAAVIDRKEAKYFEELAEEHRQISVASLMNVLKDPGKTTDEKYSSASAASFHMTGSLLILADPENKNYKNFADFVLRKSFEFSDFAVAMAIQNKIEEKEIVDKSKEILEDIVLEHRRNLVR